MSLLYQLVSVYRNGKQIIKSLAINSIELPGLLSDLLKLALSTRNLRNINFFKGYTRMHRMMIRISIILRQKFTKMPLIF